MRSIILIDKRYSLWKYYTDVVVGANNTVLSIFYFHLPFCKTLWEYRDISLFS